MKKETLIIGIVGAFILACSSIASAQRYQLGWPVDGVEHDTGGEMAVVDLNDDGSLEVIVLSRISNVPNITISVYDEQGNLLPGWPQPIGRIDSNSGFSPAVGDIDQDGDQEFFVAGKGFHHDGSPVNGWPQKPLGCFNPDDITNVYISSIVDLDGDGQKEVIGTYGTGFFSPGDPCLPGAQVFVWDGQGNLITNIALPPADANNNTERISGVAVGDLDGDGDSELVLAALHQNINTGDFAHIYAYHHTGQDVSGWPIKILDSSFSTKYLYIPTLGDIDGDGQDEVFSTYSDTLMDISRVFVWQGNGSLVSGWPQDITSPAPSSFVIPVITVGDVDEDGKLEVAFTQNNSGGPNYYVRVHLYNAENGTRVSGWPKRVNGVFNHIHGGFNHLMTSVPIITEIKMQSTVTSTSRCRLTGGCGSLVMGKQIAVVLTTDDIANPINRVFAWNADGSTVGGFPFDIVDSTISSSLLAVDLDLDGDLELGTTAYSDPATGNFPMKIHFFDLDYKYKEGEREWRQFGHDNGRTFRSF